MEQKIKSYSISDLSEGQSFSFVKRIDKARVDGFASLSGDVNPLHMSDEFARHRGFEGRVAHGGLLIAYVSELLGVYFPGENCLWQTLNIKFLLPAYINDEIEISALVSQVSLGANVVILTLEIKNTKNHIVLAKGKTQVGFTK